MHAVVSAPTLLDVPARLLSESYPPTTVTQIEALAVFGSAMFLPIDLPLSK